MFLLTFMLVNLALVVLRRRMPEVERGYRVPWFPYVPLVAAVLNLFLAVYQFNFDPTSWYVALGWILLGLLAYSIYFEKRSGEALPQVLDALPQETARAEYRILVPVANPATVTNLVNPNTGLGLSATGDFSCSCLPAHSKSKCAVLTNGITNIGL